MTRPEDRPKSDAVEPDRGDSAGADEDLAQTASISSPPVSIEELDEALPEIPGYELGELLGAGGMGVVYAATQREPIEREVALKVIRHAAISPDFLRRFDAERQALALMDHPGIAKIYDAGKTTDGRPYYSMQRVDGVKVTTYCDSEKLGTRERVQLFIDLCQPVQHAHNKGVVHRDLKPSNILVGETDGGATAHVIDFGIAKAVSGRLSPESLETQCTLACPRQSRCRRSRWARAGWTWTRAATSIRSV